MELRQFKNEIERAPNLAALDLDILINRAEWFVRQYLIYVKTHQIRRFFAAIKSIVESEKKNESEELSAPNRAKLLMLRPQMVNAGAKKGFSLKNLADVCSLMIKKIDNKEDFKTFANFFESLVAFHKAYAKD